MTGGEESNTTEQELHSMTEPEPLEEQTDGGGVAGAPISTTPEDGSP